MKREEGMELSKKLKATDYKKMEMVELFHPVTYIAWKCCSSSYNDNNNDDDDDDNDDDDDKGGG
jgi:regulator of RNase E activity RraB